VLTFFYFKLKGEENVSKNEFSGFFHFCTVIVVVSLIIQLNPPAYNIQTLKGTAQAI